MASTSASSAADPIGRGSAMAFLAVSRARIVRMPFMVVDLSDNAVTVTCGLALIVPENGCSAYK